ncbi:macrocin O-methyltransferase [bacterium]|nr:macrocin O-methyltransferase [bacterium]
MNKDIFTELVSPFSITSIERIQKLYDELEHIRINNIDGDLVECGVYKGGNILGMMEYCQFFNINKTIWAYDTFSGMTKPEDIDIDHNNIKAIDQFENIKCLETLENVKKNLSRSQYNNTKYIIGDVCNTLQIEENIPKSIALLRLDTDWFESTMCELKVLFPRLSNNGSLIIDDYGHWNGCKEAVDLYFSNSPYVFEKIDYTVLFIRKS